VNNRPRNHALAGQAQALAELKTSKG